MKDLEGDWRVERLSGLLPPMIAIWKRIRDGRGSTRFGPLPGVPSGLSNARGMLH